MSLGKDSIYILMSNIYSKGMAYLFYFITAFLLGTEAFGILKGLMPIADTLTIFFSSGIPPAIAKFLAEEKEVNINKYIPILYLMILLSIVGFILTPYIKYILGGHYLTLDTSLYFAIGFCIISSTLIAFSRGILQGLLKMKYLSSTWIVEYTVKVILVFVLTLYFGIFGSLLSISLSYLIAGIFGIYLIYKALKKKLDFKKLVDMKNITRNIFSDFNLKVLKYSIPIALTSSSYRLFGDIDSVVIMSIMGGFWSGIYGYTSLISRGIFMFASAVSIPLLPRISKTKDLNLLKEGIIQNTIFSSIFVLGCLFFPEIPLMAFFKIANPEGILCLRILAISSLFMSYYTLISSALQGLGYAKISFYIILFGLVLNIVLNLILVNAYGIVGGSLATLITSIAVFLIGVFAILRIKKHNYLIS
ncbi:polysaccharide biosynthesis protein [Methanocaldococcus bathoardescens]|uniref:Polysaccharide biosynthesis protein n=1 Tax=Methanocaldococcus bathoardescens TaxID=1301915 RepID=A0A076LAN8_9EURY|nr:flippase [Methanocaldococcus bathoardescens]AIJ05256.1 polysaccharide biosynthesis protein [Methanocaldococcus bathoardescens]